MNGPRPTGTAYDGFVNRRSAVRVCPSAQFAVRGGGRRGLNKLPTMYGRSGSPCSNATSTSSSFSGIQNIPCPEPDNGCAKRIQHDESSSFFPSRSQWNCTFTRPYLSG